jgi:hypothetical protein
VPQPDPLPDLVEQFRPVPLKCAGHPGLALDWLRRSRDAPHFTTKPRRMGRCKNTTPVRTSSHCSIVHIAASHSSTLPGGHSGVHHSCRSLKSDTRSLLTCKSNRCEQPPTRRSLSRSPSRCSCPRRGVPELTRLMRRMLVHLLLCPDTDRQGSIRQHYVEITSYSEDMFREIRALCPVGEGTSR